MWSRSGSGRLVTQCHVLERDDTLSTTEQPERSKQHDKRGQHALSRCPIDLRITLAGLAIEFWRTTDEFKPSHGANYDVHDRWFAVQSSTNRSAA
jgi:hypothetical protein